MVLTGSVEIRLLFLDNYLPRYMYVIEGLQQMYSSTLIRSPRRKVSWLLHIFSSYVPMHVDGGEPWIQNQSIVAK